MNYVGNNNFNFLYKCDIVTKGVSDSVVLLEAFTKLQKNKWPHRRE